MECMGLWDIKSSERYIYAAFKTGQMKSSQETGNEADIDFGRALMPSYFGMRRPKSECFSFRTQPWFVLFLPIKALLQKILLHQ